MEINGRSVIKVSSVRLHKLPIDHVILIVTTTGRTFELRMTHDKSVSWAAVHGLLIREFTANNETVVITTGRVAKWSVSPVVVEKDVCLTLRFNSLPGGPPETHEVKGVYRYN